ncbi:MAG: hypothetical protein J6X82_01120 [Bacteroidales bacterium]|nr:hypothetical protein [Bacteroidales bacterium]
MKRLPTLLFVLLLTASACQKDSSGTWTREDELRSIQYDAAAQMLSDLIGQAVEPELIADLKNTKPEPQYGTAYDESTPYDRTVTVDDAQEAEDLFCGLGGWRDDVLQETPEGYLIDFSDIGVGTLEFFRQPDGANVGYATVDIPCIPHLQRLTYKTKDQIGDNAAGDFVSPARYGDVYLHENRYYICIKAATGYSYDSQGYMVCVEAGKGSNWSNYLSDEKWGCWKPKQNWTNSRYIVAFLKLCADTKFRQDKAQIVKKFPGKVFPRVQRWRKYDKQEDIGDLTWGFGALDAGYSHVTRYSANLADEKSNSDKEKSKWGRVRAIIARDATEGDYQWRKAKWQRRFHYYAIPWVCRLDKGLYSDVYKYTGKGGWEDFFEDNSLIVYTLNAVSFNESLPSGYVLQNIWDDED